MKEFIIVNKSIGKEDLNDVYQMYQSGTLSDLRCIGRGTEGIIYQFGQYAIKVFRKSRQDESVILEKLQGNPNIPTLYAYIPNKLMIMDYIAGDVIPNVGKEDIQAEHNWVGQIIDALTFVYEHGFIPSDIHDQNIMFDFWGKPFLIDFGSYKENTSKEVNKKSILRDVYEIQERYKYYSEKKALLV